MADKDKPRPSQRPLEQLESEMDARSERNEGKASFSSLLPWLKRKLFKRTQLNASSSDLEVPEALSQETSYHHGCYDVFISHRGPDTKTGLAGYLHDRLIQFGLKPFLDCKDCEKGDDSWKCIEHAIKSSPISIVIFSKGFAESTWCMKELHIMMENPTIHVLPIYYNIAPSDVRYAEKGRLKEGLKKLNQHHDGKVDIEKWKSNLERASHKIGWEYYNGGKMLEVDLVKEVVSMVIKLTNKALPLHVEEYSIGVQELAQEIIYTLELNNKKKQNTMLGLWGMGGIGKTTLAKELYNQLHKKFEHATFVENWERDGQAVSRRISQLQYQLLKGLQCDIDCITSVAKGKNILQERLQQKRILVVLDDVNESELLETLMSRSMLRNGSVCIVTSRDKQVFEEASFDFIHEVQFLDKDKAMQVFTSHAFGGDCKVKPGFECLVDRITKACGGLPLVLKVCGALLKMESNIEVWKEVLEKLEKGHMMGEKKIFVCLRISYDALESEDQKMFLDLACALLGQPVDTVKRVWKAQGCFVEYGIRHLLMKALVTVDTEGRFTMHNHLRDMGREIVKLKVEASGVYTHLWMPLSFKHLNNKEVLKNVETLIVYGSTIEAVDISHMEKLRILIHESSIQINAIPANVHMLQCKGVSDESTEEIWSTNPIPIPDVNSLVVMNLENKHPDCFLRENNDTKFSGIQELNFTNSCIFTFEGNISNFKGLEVLDLSSCQKLETLPNGLGSLSNLSKLNLTSCYRLQKLPDSLGQLKKLEELLLSDCWDVKSLPEGLGDLDNLVVLDMSGHCITWNTASNLKLISQLRNLQRLDLSSWELSRTHGLVTFQLPDSFGNLRNLLQLDLSDNKGLKVLPTSMGNMTNLKDLNLRLCSKLQTLPDSLGKMINLEHLDLDCCLSLQNLPQSIGNLGRIMELNLQRCNALQTLPDSIGNLENLGELSLASCNSLQSLPKSLGKLRSLRKLDLKNCKRLLRLPDSFVQLTTLRELDCSYCIASEGNLPGSFGTDFSALRKLNIHHQYNLRVLPDSINGLTGLQELDLSYLFSLQALPDCLGQMSGLLRLLIGPCKGLSTLPSSLGNLKRLQLLRLYSCPSIRRLPESLESLSELRKLQILSCEGLECLPVTLGKMTNLVELSVSRCYNLRDVPESVGQLKQLRKLDLMECPELKTLCNSVGVLDEMVELDLTGCEKLRYLPPLGQLKKLQSLIIVRCVSLRGVPESLANLRVPPQVTYERTYRKISCCRLERVHPPHKEW